MGSSQQWAEQEVWLTLGLTVPPWLSSGHLAWGGCRHLPCGMRGAQQQLAGTCRLEGVELDTIQPFQTPKQPHVPCLRVTL